MPNSEWGPGVPEEEQATPNEETGFSKELLEKSIKETREGLKDAEYDAQRDTRDQVVKEMRLKTVEKLRRRLQDEEAEYQRRFGEGN